MMKTKEVIVLAFLSKTDLTPLLLTYDNDSMYLHIDPQGCALFGKDSPEPFYRMQEPLLLAHGVMTDCKTVHLVVLKTSGELSYTLISGSSTPQTTLIAQLDVRALRYRRLFLFPQGKIVHIFYAHTHQAIRDLWRIEHRYWDGSRWHSVHLGEVVHPREPLYHVNLDSQGNLHLLTLTFQGRHSLLYTNRFNGTFHIWGSPAETLKISGEVVDSAALMTPDNVHHLYWVIKSSNGQFEIRWAQQTDAHELTSTWHPSPAPIKTFRPPWKNIGALEINGALWLLAHTGEVVLMKNDGKGWRLISSHTPFHHPFKWVHKGKRNFHQTYWLEDQVERRAPVYYHELGYTIKKETMSQPTSFQATLPIHCHAIPPVPAFYPDLITPDPPPPTSIIEKDATTSSQTLVEPNEPAAIITNATDTNEISSVPSPVEVDEAPEVVEVLDAHTQDAQDIIDIIDTIDSQEIIVTPDIQDTTGTTSTPETQTEDVLPSLPLKEALELERLITSVAHLEQENTNLGLVLQTMLSKFDQILGAISDNVSQPKQSEQSVQNPSPPEESAPSQTQLDTTLEEADPVQEAMHNLEKETESLSQVLRVMLAKQEQNDSSLENLALQISQLQEEKKELKNKGGFWNKWIT